MRAGGFVLTGGKSIRMGRDKALLPVGDSYLVQTVANRLLNVTPVVTLVGQPQRYRHLPWPCLPDIRPGLGPLAGLETALTNTKAKWNLVLACDMPNLQEDWLAALLRCAESTDAPCVATVDLQGKVHPLCAAYRVDCLVAISRALDEGRLKLTTLLKELGTELLQAQTGLDNLNTPNDWAQWQQTHRHPV